MATKGPTAGIVSLSFLLCILCGTAAAQDVSVVSFSVRHFQGYKPGAEANWTRWADKEWYPDPSKPGFYEFFTRVFDSLGADIIAIQGAPVPEHDAERPGGGPGEMAIVPELARRLGMHYWVQDRSRFHGLAFLSRFPILQAEDFTFQGAPGTGLVRITVQLDGGARLHVYNTYLQYDDPAARLREITFALSTMEKEALRPRLYVGDFRVHDVGSTELDPLRKAGYVGQGQGSHCLWCERGAEAEVLACVAVENELTAAELSQGGPVASDQLPVKAVVRVGGMPSTPDERRDALLQALGHTDKSMGEVERLVTAEAEPVHGPCVLSRMTLGEDQFRRTDLVPAVGQSFSQALRVRTKEKPANIWDVSVGASIDRPVAKGDLLVATFWARALPGPAGTPSARVAFRFQQNKPPWEGSVNSVLDLDGEWRCYRIPFRSLANYGPGDAAFRFHCGYDQQVLELGGVCVANCRRNLSIGDAMAFARWERQTCPTSGA